MKPFNLDQPIQGWDMHIGGMYGSGKTTLIADMLLHEQQHGPVAYVMTPGEGDSEKGGWRSIAGLGLGEVAYYVETLKDMEELQAKFRKEKYRAVGLDTLVGLANLIRIEICGEDRMPTSQGFANEYGKVLNRFESFTRLWANSSYYTMSVSPTDIVLKDDQTGQTPTMAQMDQAPRFHRPMMPWQKLEFVVPGLFDLCFQIECSGIKTTNERILRVRQGKEYGTKQRLPKNNRLTNDIKLCDDMDNWKRIITALGSK